MLTLEFCEANIKDDTVVVGPDDMVYKVTDTRLNGPVREYELSTLSGQWSNWFPFTDIKKIVRQPKK